MDTNEVRGMVRNALPYDGDVSYSDLRRALMGMADLLDRIEPADEPDFHRDLALGAMAQVAEKDAEIARLREELTLQSASPDPSDENARLLAEAERARVKILRQVVVGWLSTESP